MNPEKTTDADILRRRKYILLRTRIAAKRYGYRYELTVNDIKWVDKCPITGVPINLFDPSSSPYAPMLKLTRTRFGYVAGNVRLVARSAMFKRYSFDRISDCLTP